MYKENNALHWDTVYFKLKKNIFQTYFQKRYFQIFLKTLSKIKLRNKVLSKLLKSVLKYIWLKNENILNIDLHVVQWTFFWVNPKENILLYCRRNYVIDKLGYIKILTFLLLCIYIFTFRIYHFHFAFL